MKNLLNLKWLLSDNYEKQSPHRFARYAAMLIMLLTLGVGQMWADQSLDNVYMDWYFNDVQFYTINGNAAYGYASSDNRGTGVLYDLGILTTDFKIKSIYWKVSTNWDPNCCNGWMKYKINGGEEQTMNYNSDCGNGSNQQIGGDFNPNHIVATASGAPGEYYFVHYFEAYFCYEGGANKSVMNNSSSNYNFKYTIPGFTTTSTSFTFNNTTVSGQSNAIIPFGTHYGTELTTSNCAISGTNYTEFEVRGITETNVNVAFKPTSAGDKSATLTITDAHGKTCTITLSGKTQYTVTYNKGNYGSGDERKVNKVYGENLTLADKGYFTYTGHTQTAWNTNLSGEGGTSYALNGTYSTEAAITLYPTWAYATYTVTLAHGLGGSGSGSLTVTYNSTTINNDMTHNLTNTGYHLDGFYPSEESDLRVLESNGIFAAANVEGYITNSSWSHDGNCTLHAHWAANTYEISFDATTNSGAIVDAGSTYDDGGTRKITATYGSTISGTMPTARKDGYYFKGWYTAASGGSQVVDASGVWQNVSGYTNASKQWQRAENTTLYAQYEQPSITSLTFTPERVLPLGSVKVTPTFDVEPEGTYSFCYKLTLGTSPYTRMQVQPTFTPTGENIGEVTFDAPSAAHTYAVEVRLYNEASHDCSSDGSPVSTYDSHAQTFEVETANEITVNYVCGNANVYPSTIVYATEAQTTATITAPDIVGLTFSSWSYDADKITATGGTSSSTNPITITASESTTLTANYTQGPLFFKKPANWEHVYIYFYSITTYWRNPTDVDKREGTGSKSGWGITSGPIELTNIVEGTTDVYYYDLSTTPTCVVFSDLSMSDYEYFSTVNGTIPNIVRVTSFDSNNPMIVPTGSGTLRNQGAARYFDYDKVPLVTDWGWTVRCEVDGWVNTHRLQSEKMGDLTFSSKIYLTRASHGYLWRLYAADGSTPYGKQSPTPTLTYSNPTSPTLVANDGNLYIKTNIPGYYTFTATYGTGTTYLGNNITVNVSYPVNENDYRLLYDDNNLNPHPSSIIHKRNNGKDTVNMFYDPDHTPVLKMQKCTDISVSESDDVDPTTWTSTTLDLSAFSTVLSKAGVYNFIVEQDASGLNPTIVKIEPYTGRFYVRTDCVDDKWEYQKSKDKHEMTYSEFSTTLTTKPYSHYYVKDVDATSDDVNIRFTVATDYSEAICDTVFNGDANDTWGNESINRRQKLNVRFTYNQETNKIWRAYTEGPANNDYMVLRTDNSHVFKTADGSAIDTLRFQDMGNWVYQVDAYATVGSYVKLTADAHYYGGGESQKRQYIKGNDNSGYTEETAILLLGGSSESKEHMRIMYDFKTDRMVTSWLPSHAVSGTLSINADVMLKRTHQGAGESITLSSNDSKLDAVKTVYGVMEFQKDYITDDSYSTFIRDLYWISFPFDVKLSDVFGFGTYGVHWIIEYYDGKGRAEHGFWADSEPNWKFVMPDKRNDYVLKANEGYILALDLDEMGDRSPVWTNVTSVYLYFPSHANVNDITKADNKTVVIEQDGYECTINRATGTEGDRRIKDSYWHCIGVPSFANSTRTSGTVGTAEPTSWSANIPYVYVWNPTSNTLSVSTSASFEFNAMHSYMVQYNCTTLTWSNVVVPNVTSVIARQRLVGEEARFKEFCLNLRKEEQQIDHTYIRFTEDENATEYFDFGMDLSKEMNTGGNIYTKIDYERVAGNVQPKPVQTTLVPVGVKVVTGGEYTLAMPEGTNGEDVYLIDNAYGTRTNLGLMPYTVTLTAGTYEGRFALEFGPIQDAPTGIEQMSTVNSQLSTDSVRKVFVGGRLYIIRDGKVYDAAGQRVE